MTQRGAFCWVGACSVSEEEKGQAGCRIDSESVLSWLQDQRRRKGRLAVALTQSQC